jgi:hypothetical protein
MTADIYFGSNLSNIELDVLALKHVKPELRGLEAGLYQTKWFDYRHLHPVSATYLFAHHYQEQVRVIYAKTRDIEKAKDAKAFVTPDIFVLPELTAIVTARQAYDRIGMRYDFGIAYTFNRTCDRGWGYFPRPNQLYGEELLMDLSDAWHQRCVDSYQFVQESRFKMNRYVGHPDQIAHQEWALNQCTKRQHPHMLLSTLLKEQYVNPEIAARKLGVEVTQKAMKLVAAM